MHKKHLTIGVIGAVLLVGAEMLNAILMQRIIDAARVADASKLMEILPMIALFVVLVLIGSISKTIGINRYVSHRILQYKDFMFHRFLKSLTVKTETDNSGVFLSLVTNDVNEIEQNYYANIFDLIICTMLFIASLAIMFLYNVFLALFVIVGGLIIVYISNQFEPLLTRLQQKLSKSNALFLSRIKDYILGINVVIDFEVDDHAKRYFNQENKALEVTKVKRKTMFGLFVEMIKLTASLYEVLVFLVASYLAINGQITIGTIILFAQLMNFTMLPVTKVPQLLAARKASKSLMKSMETKYELVEDKERQYDLKAVSHSIKLTNIDVLYDDIKVLNHVSFKFEEGKRYAIVGGSGSGKSTLLKVIRGQVAYQSGSVIYDEIDAQTLKLSSFAHAFTYIDQNIFIFDDTLLFNITLERPYTKALLDEVIQKAGLQALVLAKGLDFRCGENGVNLSGGERQRISIARALLKRTSVLLLDEINSALDPLTAKDIMNDILSLTDTTIISVTHRLIKSDLQRFDTIIVLKQGQIVETGHFDDLMAKKSLFYHMYEYE